MMRRRIFGNNNARYILAAIVIIVAFLLLGGAQWLTGLMHGGISGLNWPQILISLILGFLLGLLRAKENGFNLILKKTSVYVKMCRNSNI